jgi:plasmid stabilization system protein ParE
MVKRNQIEWTLSARSDFKEILSYYKKRSLQGHQLVKSAILAALVSASHSAKAFVKDELKRPSDENVRTFTVYHIRVAYLVLNKKIIVLRLRHTSREPLEY